MLFGAWQFKTEVSVGDILSFLTLVFTFGGLWLAYRQLKRGVHDQRAQFLLELTGRYFADKEVRQFYYRLENNKFSFNPKTFPETDDERCLDQLIYTFDVIGWAVRTGSISISEAQIFAFQAAQVLNNPEVGKYLSDLDDHYKQRGRPTPAHGDVRFLVATLNAGHFNS